VPITPGWHGSGGHRTLAIVRKGGKKVTIPLAPRTARAIDLAIGERGEGPIFLSPGGARLDRHGAGRSEAARAVLCCAASMVNPVRRRWGARRLRAPRFGGRACRLRYARTTAAAHC